MSSLSLKLAKTTSSGFLYFAIREVLTDIVIFTTRRNMERSDLGQIEPGCPALQADSVSSELPGKSMSSS